MAEQNADLRQNNRINFRIGIHVGDTITTMTLLATASLLPRASKEIADSGGVSTSDDAGSRKVDLQSTGSQTLRETAERVWRVITRGEALFASPQSD